MVRSTAEWKQIEREDHDRIYGNYVCLPFFSGTIT
jgi:hypothetical protein